MGKAAMCIRMLQYLNSGRIYKISELADLMETNPRNIIEYKRELEEVGYYIISIPGKNGGYQLDKSATIPSLKFTLDEQKALAEGAGYISSRNDFLYKNDFEMAIAKVYSSISRSTPEERITVLNRFPLLMPEDELNKRYDALKSCLAPSRKELGRIIEITYLSQSNEVSTRNLHPYKLFMFNNAWFVLGFDEKSGEIRYFKLNRIQSFRLTSQKFRVLLAYNESDYLGEFGMKQNGEWYPIKLELHGKYAMLVRERLYGKNQTLECIDNDTTILSCEMQNKDDIISFVMGFGADCRVIEPGWLKRDVKNICREILGAQDE